MRSRIVSRGAESKRPPNPWGPLFQPSSQGADPDLFIWSVFRTFNQSYGKAVNLSSSPTHEEVLRALINAGHIGGVGITTAVSKFAVVLKGGLPTKEIEVLNYSGKVEFILERNRQFISFTDPRVRKPNPWGPLFQPAARSGSSEWLPFLMPGWRPLLYRVHLPEPLTRGDIETFFYHRYGNSPRDIIFLDEDRIKVVYPREEIILTRFEELRKANPFGPIFSTGQQGPASSDEVTWDIFKDNRTLPGAFHGRFFLPRHPVSDEVFDMLGAWIFGKVETAKKVAELMVRKPGHILVVTKPVTSPPTILFHLVRRDGRQPNPFGPIFASGSSRPDEELYRWNVLLPSGSWTHVFLPKYPSIPEIADALGREFKDVVTFDKMGGGDRRGVEFSDLSYYELNRVW